MDDLFPLNFGGRENDVVVSDPVAPSADLGPSTANPAPNYTGGNANSTTNPAPDLSSLALPAPYQNPGCWLVTQTIKIDLSIASTAEDPLTFPVYCDVVWFVESQNSDNSITNRQSDLIWVTLNDPALNDPIPFRPSRSVMHGRIKQVQVVNAVIGVGIVGYLICLISPATDRDKSEVE